MPKLFLAHSFRPGTSICRNKIAICGGDSFATYRRECHFIPRQTETDVAALDAPSPTRSPIRENIAPEPPIHYETAPTRVTEVPTQPTTVRNRVRRVVHHADGLQLGDRGWTSG